MLWLNDTYMYNFQVSNCLRHMLELQHTNQILITHPFNVDCIISHNLTDN